LTFSRESRVFTLAMIVTNDGTVYRYICGKRLGDNLYGRVMTHAMTYGKPYEFQRAEIEQFMRLPPEQFRCNKELEFRAHR